MKPAIFTLMLIASLAFGQQKPKELPRPPARPAATDTTVNRVALIKLLQDQMETYQKNANAQLQTMQGQIGILSVLKDSTVTIGKEVFK